MFPGIKYRVILPLLLILLLVTGGCIREDQSGCVRGLSIYFQPENPKHDYPQLVESVNLYFYDGSGNLTRVFTYDREELQGNERAAVVQNLPQGEYTLISVVNPTESYPTTGEQRLESLQSRLKNRTIDYPLDDFFSGLRTFTVTGGSGEQKEVADIFKHNNDIRVEIVFDGYDPPSGTLLDTYIEGINGAYSYHNATCPEDQIITYLPHHIGVDSGGIPSHFEFTVMRLWRDAEIILYLNEDRPSPEPGQSIRLDIVDELAKVVNDRNEFLYDTDAKLSFTDEYRIVITLGPELVVLEMTINDWAVIRKDIDV